MNAFIKQIPLIGSALLLSACLYHPFYPDAGYYRDGYADTQTNEYGVNPNHYNNYPAGNRTYRHHHGKSHRAQQVWEGQDSQSRYRHEDYPTAQPYDHRH
jgi:hypothetical protein